MLTTLSICYYKYFIINKKSIFLLILILCLFAFVLSPIVIERFLELGLNSNGRIPLYISSIRLIDNYERLLFGYGFGAFHHISGIFKSEYLHGGAVWKTLHSDVFEFIISVGLIGVLMFCCFLYKILKQSIDAITSNSLHIPFIASLLYLLFHGLIDFNLKNPVISIHCVMSLAILTNIDLILKNKAS